MNLFRWFLVAIFVGLAGVFGLSAAQRSGDKPTVVRIATPLTREHATAASLETFKQTLESLSEGTLRVEIYYAAQLGGQDQTLNLTRMGDLEIAHIGGGVLSPYVLEANAIVMPFIWNDWEHFQRAMEGEVGELLRARTREADIQIGLS